MKKAEGEGKGEVEMKSKQRSLRPLFSFTSGFIYVLLQRQADTVEVLCFQIIYSMIH